VLGDQGTSFSRYHVLSWTLDSTVDAVYKCNECCTLDSSLFVGRFVQCLYSFCCVESSHYIYQSLFLENKDMYVYILPPLKSAFWILQTKYHSLNE
jgi:hypothetical protein